MLDKKSQLVNLGAEALADGLLSLTHHFQAAEDLVDTMISTSQDNIKIFKSKLAGLKRMTRYVAWNEVDDFARDLECLLENLKSGVQNPKDGLDCILAFYDMDDVLFNHCDDSGGSIGGLFRYNATDIVVHYGLQYQDRNELIQKILITISKDDYGIRDSLIDGASRYLSSSEMRELIDKITVLLEGIRDDGSRRHQLSHIRSLAKQLKDPKLYEKTSIDYWKTGESNKSDALPIVMMFEIAETYFEAGDAPTALCWMDRIDEKESYFLSQRDDLYFKLYSALGDRPKLEEAAWKLFRNYRTEKSLAQLLSVIGEERKKTILDQEVLDLANKEGPIDYHHVSFMMRMGYVNEVEAYLLRKQKGLNGDYYGDLLPLAESFEQHQRYLITSLLYRALLDSILKRAKSKTYSHGVRYLKKLENIAHHVIDWHEHSTHDEYFEQLKLNNKRKSSFWGLYK